MALPQRGPEDWLPLLSNRSFMALWLSRALTGAGEWVGQVALMALVFQLTASSTWVAVLQSIHAVPVLLLAPIVGVLIDHWDRRLTLMIAHLVRGLLFLTLAFAGDLPQILVTYLAVNLAMLFFVPGTSSLLPSLVGRQQLVAANSLTSTTSNVAMIFGASLGGAIIFWFGIPVAIALDGVCSIVAAAGLSLVVAPAMPRPVSVTVGRFWRELVDGARYTTRNGIVAAVVLMTAMMAVGSGAINTLAIVFAGRVLGGGSTEYSAMLTACGIGALFGSLLVIKAGFNIPPHRVFNVGFLVLACAILLISASSYLPAVGLFHLTAVDQGPAFALPLQLAAAALAYLVAGMGQVAVSIMGNVMVQSATRPQFLGRVFGLMQMVRHATSFLSVALCGWSADHIPVQVVILALGVVSLVSAGLSFKVVRIGSQT